MVGEIKTQTDMVKINDRLNFYYNIVTFDHDGRDIVLYDSNKKVVDSWEIDEDKFKEGFYDVLINGLKNIKNVEELRTHFFIYGFIVETNEEDEEDYSHTNTFNTENGCVYLKVYY